MANIKKINEIFNNKKIKYETLAYYRQKTNILKREVLKKNLQKEKQDAILMETFLNNLKNDTYNEETLGDLITQESFESLRNELPVKLFKSSHERKVTDKRYDDIFEKQLATVFKKMIVKNKRNKINFAMGTTTANVLSKNTEGNLQSILNNYKNDFITYLGESVIEDIETITKKNNTFNTPQGRAQKTDIGIKIEATQDISPEYLNVMNLFNNYNFSLKNYSSNITDNGLKVTLGSSNPLKAIIGTLTSLGEDEKVATKAFYAALSVYYRDGLTNEEGKELAGYVFGMRYYYELTGAGLKINGEDISKVDFLIINNPGGKIYVRSTKELSLSVLNDTSYITKYNPFREVHAYIKLDK